MGSKYHYKWAIIGPPAKRHLNGVRLTGDDGPTLNVGLIALCISRGSGPVLPFIFQGEGPDPPTPPPMDPRMSVIATK